MKVNKKLILKYFVYNINLLKIKNSLFTPKKLLKIYKKNLFNYLSRKYNKN